MLFIAVLVLTIGRDDDNCARSQVYYHPVSHLCTD